MSCETILFHGICFVVPPVQFQLNHSTLHWTICVCLKTFVNVCVNSYFTHPLPNRAPDHSLSSLIMSQMVLWWIIILKTTNWFLFGGIVLTFTSGQLLIWPNRLWLIGEPFHKNYLRMIISLLFEPFRNSSLDHVRFVCAIWYDCILGGIRFPSRVRCVCNDTNSCTNGAGSGFRRKIERDGGIQKKKKVGKRDLRTPIVDPHFITKPHGRLPLIETLHLTRT